MRFKLFETNSFIQLENTFTMALDFLTNIFREFFRPFRKRKRKQMEHGALNMSLSSLVSNEESADIIQEENFEDNSEDIKSKRKKNKTRMSNVNNADIDQEEYYQYNSEDNKSKRKGNKIRMSNVETESSSHEYSDNSDFQYFSEQDSTTFEKCSPNNSTDSEKSSELTQSNISIISSNNDHNYKYDKDSSNEAIDSVSDNRDMYYKELMNELKKNEKNESVDDKNLDFFKQYEETEVDYKINLIIKNKMDEYLIKKM